MAQLTDIFLSTVASHTASSSPSFSTWQSWKSDIISDRSARMSWILKNPSNGTSHLLYQITAFLSDCFCVQPHLHCTTQKLGWSTNTGPLDFFSRRPLMQPHPLPKPWHPHPYIGLPRGNKNRLSTFLFSLVILKNKITYYLQKTPCFSLFYMVSY